MDPKKQKAILKEIQHQQSHISHLHPSDTVLILGESDGAYSMHLAWIGFDITATFYDNIGTVRKNYGQIVMNHTGIIQRLGNNIYYKVDIGKIRLNEQLNGKQFDKIIFNYPHTGVPNYMNEKNIQSNRQLLRSIFLNAPIFMTRNSELHIVLKDEPIYNTWNIQLQNKTVNNKLRLKYRNIFHHENYFGYYPQSTEFCKNLNVNSCNSYLYVFGFFDKDSEWNPIKVSVGKQISADKFRCELCNLSCGSNKKFLDHIKGKKHRWKSKN
eukprot:22714_1